MKGISMDTAAQYGAWLRASNPRSPGKKQNAGRNSSQTENEKDVGKGNGGGNFRTSIVDLECE